jgi:hypothetical protein
VVEGSEAHLAQLSPLVRAHASSVYRSQPAAGLS